MEAGDDGKEPEESGEFVEQHREGYQLYSSPQTHEVDERLQNSLVFISQAESAIPQGREGRSGNNVL